jgi:hypothetical protein
MGIAEDYKPQLCRMQRRMGELSGYSKKFEMTKEKYLGSLTKWLTTTVSELTAWEKNCETLPDSWMEELTHKYVEWYDAHRVQDIDNPLLQVEVGKLSAEDESSTDQEEPMSLDDPKWVAMYINYLRKLINKHFMGVIRADGQTVLYGCQMYFRDGHWDRSDTTLRQMDAFSQRLDPDLDLEKVTQDFQAEAQAFLTDDQS